MYSAKDDSKKKIKCTNKSLREADRCGEELFFAGENSRTYPTNEPEAVKYCTESQNLVRCVKTYTDSCARSELRKNLANVMLYTARNTHKSVCSSKSKRSKLLIMGGCANKIRQQSNKCVAQMLKEFGQAQGLFDSSFRVPYGCCAFHKMRDCIRDNSSSKCQQAESDAFDAHVQNMAGNTLRFLCTEYDEDEAGDKCGKVLKMKFDPKSSKTPNSLIHAFGELLALDAKLKEQP